MSGIAWAVVILFVGLGWSVSMLMLGYWISRSSGEFQARMIFERYEAELKERRKAI